MKKQTGETAVKQQVKHYLRLKNWLVFHHLAGLGCYPGISDFTAIKEGRTVWVEVKTDKGKQSERQVEFQALIEGHGGEYIVIRSLEDAIRFDSDPKMVRLLDTDIDSLHCRRPGDDFMPQARGNRHLTNKQAN